VLATTVTYLNAYAPREFTDLATSAWMSVSSSQTGDRGLESMRTSAHWLDLGVSIRSAHLPGIRRPRFDLCPRY
jgi:hypothetical protein